METVEYKNISFTVWDVGGQDKVTLLLVFDFWLVIKDTCAYQESITVAAEVHIDFEMFV